MSQRFRIRADVDDLWQTLQPGPFSEKQPQWLTLQLCLVTVGVTEWIECSRFNHLFQTNGRRKLTPGSVLGPLRGRKGKTRQDKMMMMVMMILMVMMLMVMLMMIMMTVMMMLMVMMMVMMTILMVMVMMVIMMMMMMVMVMVMMAMMMMMMTETINMIRIMTIKVAIKFLTCLSRFETSRLSFPRCLFTNPCKLWEIKKEVNFDS